MAGNFRSALMVSAATLTLVASVAPPAISRFAVAGQTRSPQLLDLRNVSEFRARFNADSEFTRLILLVSPT